MSAVAPRPDFLSRDPEQITDEMVQSWENATKKPLFPAQVERLLINQMAYRETLTRQGIQETGEQNLLSFASSDALDALGVLLACHRFIATPAVAIVRLALITAQPHDSFFAEGTAARADDGRMFVTIAPARIPAGESSTEATVKAVIPGASGNGIEAGRLRELAPIRGVVDGNVTVTNTSTTQGGRDTENDESYRERLLLAASRASTGTLEAYRLHALSVSPRIIDVGIEVPEPGRVRIYLLTDEGEPDDALLSVATAFLNAETRRPLTDWVEVLPAVRITMPLSVELLISPRAVNAKVEVAERLQTLARLRRSTLGADLRTEHVAAQVMQVAGVMGIANLSFEWNRRVRPGEFLNIEPIEVEVVGGGHV